jgi:hypothetical protein
MKLLLLAAFVTYGPCAIATTLPVPPIPPEDQQLAEAAPVPDRDAQAPVAPTSNDPSVDVRLYRTKNYDSSAGFVPGSRYQSAEDRKPIQTPGIAILVPLQ